MGLRSHPPANPKEVEPPELGQAHRCGCTQGGSLPSGYECVYIYLDKQKTSVLEPSAATCSSIHLTLKREVLGMVWWFYRKPESFMMLMTLCKRHRECCSFG